MLFLLPGIQMRTKICPPESANSRRYFRFIHDANLLSCRLKNSSRRHSKASTTTKRPGMRCTRCSRIGSREVLDIASYWCRSDEPLKRARGADVLAQLGKTADHPKNNFPEESFNVVVALAESEKHIQPLSSAIQALGHIGDPRAVPLLVRHSTHPEAEIRFAVACASGSFANDPALVVVLLELMRDPDEDVRDWATLQEFRT